MVEYLIIDGYNIINTWGMLESNDKHSFESARDALIDIMHNYKGYTGYRITIVFDAYQTESKKRTIETNRNITVVYTKKNESADVYIERFVNDVMEKSPKNTRVWVATSDHLQQTITSSKGALIVSAMELKADVERATNDRTKRFQPNDDTPNHVFERLSGDAIDKLKQLAKEIEK
ncbi:MAG: NYN domain-containing protein [Clostridiales bacterium]|nr:NYN domain-containing protein [Clostridiales bacterium]